MQLRMTRLLPTRRMDREVAVAVAPLWAVRQAAVLRSVSQLFHLLCTTRLAYCWKCLIWSTYFSSIFLVCCVLISIATGCERRCLVEGIRLPVKLASSNLEGSWQMVEVVCEPIVKIEVSVYFMLGELMVLRSWLKLSSFELCQNGWVLAEW